MTIQIALILLNLLIAGVIFSHLVLTTPVIFKILDEESAAKFLRAIFPRYYLLIFLLSLPILLILFFQDSSLNWWLAINLSIHALVGLLGVPITNAAKDRGWNKIFSFTHGVSVYCTIVIFALSLIQFFLYLWSFHDLHKKLTLQEKLCKYCLRSFVWRKNWERSWDEVKFCSSRCKAESKKRSVHLEVRWFNSIFLQRG